MERANIKKLINWKNKKNRKPLLVTGVRQCGKTLRKKKNFMEVDMYNISMRII